MTASRLTPQPTPKPQLDFTPKLLDEVTGSAGESGQLERVYYLGNRLVRIVVIREATDEISFAAAYMWSYRHSTWNEFVIEPSINWFYATKNITHTPTQTMLGPIADRLIARVQTILQGSQV